ncbi:hypothetical protein [Acidicapsa acidisoli]|uniref:hypothetical protein n=1 Tax=Acidicapsa acidisoli TaxID=1615681 RepID=UPI0021E020DF|nr:hypothetical protein [Acidicapsa acidisoli]
MKYRILISIILATACWQSRAQDNLVSDTPVPDAPTPQSRYDFRFSFAAIDDATVYSNLQAPIPQVLNQVLLEPSFTLRYQRWSLSSSVVGLADTYTDTATQLRVKEAYAGLSAGDFDFTLGRRIVRWGTGYAFTAAGVLDPPRDPTNPTDRLSLNEGRDMIKADWVHGPHAMSLAWSTAALAPAQSNLHDTTAFRYNVLVHGFDTSLIAGHDRGSDTFSGLTFTRVLGEAWELHGEAAWREHEAILLGGKYTTTSGVTFIGEFFTPPNIPYYRDATVFPLVGRQHYAFLRAGKTRLRELPGWKQWDLAASVVANLNDRSCTAIFDTERRFGNRFSSYLHLEIPAGRATSEYGSTPYSAASSMGVRFQL